MCTAIGMSMGDFYFGRNMDIEYELGGKITVTPRKYPLSFTNGELLHSHSAIMGMSVIKNNYPLYADAFNESGLCMAGLNFPENAYFYPKQQQEKNNIAPFEIIPYILGKCESVRQAKALLEHSVLVDIPFDSDMPNAPLHWIIADKAGSLVLEQTANGLSLYENMFGVLANNPPFPFHTENMKKYINLSPKYRLAETFSDLSPFGGGMCAIGLPGDYSSPSRFVKSAFLCRVCRVAEDISEQQKASHLFSLLYSVAPPMRAVLDQDENSHFTVYSSCINADKGFYYIHEYKNTGVFQAKLSDYNTDGTKLIALS